MKIVDTQNKEKTEFSAKETFKVMIPMQKLKEAGSFKIHLSTQVETKPVIYGKAPNGSYQDYALTAATYEDSVQDLVDNYYKNETKIKIIKQDDETKEKLSGVEFALYDANKQMVYGNLKTNEDGEVEVQNILPGTYYLQETVAKDGYLPNREMTQIEVKWNQIVTVKVYNLKEDEKKKPTIEIEKNEISTKVKRLPVTGM